MTDDPKLSYCPFCGSNSTHLSYPGYGGRVQVICDACEARGGIARTEKSTRASDTTRQYWM